MKNIVYVLLLMYFAPATSMQKPGLLQAYKNWVYVQTLKHFTTPAHNNSETRPLDQCRYIPLKQLHQALDWEIKKHIFMHYVLPPAVAITTVATVGMITYKNVL